MPSASSATILPSRKMARYRGKFTSAREAKAAGWYSRRHPTLEASRRAKGL